MSLPVAGDALPRRELPVARADVIRYCGASGDFNPLHWSDSRATAAGLPGVIAHGMLTMGVAARVVTDWCGDPGAIVSYAARFARPFAVPDADLAPVVLVEGQVTEVRGDVVVLALNVSTDGEQLLSRAEVSVRWPTVD
jgi:acyl dehydratase